jgi:NADPH-dependent ferric siderophore reductase
MDTVLKSHNSGDAGDVPRVTRVRHETKRRQLNVTRVDQLAPKMVRVVLQGDDLPGFTSLGFDDHVKIFFPCAPDSPLPEPIMRDFTPRRYDPDTGELWIDFCLHETGPASDWASQVAVGQELTVAGPRGSAVIPLEGIDVHLLVGDATALPAIGRRLEELPAHGRALVVLDTEGEADGYPLTSAAQLEVVKVPRGDTATGADRIIEVLRNLRIPTGSCFCWVAAESHVARAIRHYLLSERGIDKRWIKAAGYWRRGAVGTHENITDEE